jgi:hypothetical protein
MQMFEVLQNVDDAYFRRFLWGQPAVDEVGEPVGFAGSSTSPEHWFGHYSTERFWAANEAVEKMWKVFRDAETDIIDVHLQCPDAGENPGNICFTGHPYGHHSVKGWINVCDEAFDDSAGLYPNNQDAVTHTIMHEAMHHLGTHFDAGFRALADTHTHGHGSSCVSSIDHLDYIVGYDEVRHLATYEAADGEHCWHMNYAIQSPEAYALFAMRIGEGVRDGELYQWPKYADPTPQPPECQGDPGCLCDDVTVFDSGPDGDYDIGQLCSDHDGEATCVETEVNAGAIVGICKKCDDLRGPGCECDDQLLCDVGSCFGDDTFNGGVGHCYLEPPPSWACLVDCERLFNDPLAWCYHDHLGGARCMDSDCAPWDAEDCYQDGMICRGGECVVECYSNADCGTLGYPDYMECTTAGRCEYAF